MNGRGWAVVEGDGRIVINSVGDTRRVALVNWLLVERNIALSDVTTDEQIEDVWNALRKIAPGYEVVEVEVTTKVEG